MVKVLILFYSTYGHNYAMANAAAKGAKEVEGAQVTIKRVPETLPKEVLEKMGAIEAQKQFEHIPTATPQDLAEADVVVFGVPTRFGSIAAQMKTFLDSCGQLWMTGATVGKVATVWSSSNTQHGGQETTILGFHPVLFHLGFIVTGLPYSFKGQSGIEEVKGCSPYGASTIAGDKGQRMPSQTELDGVAFQAKHATEIGKKLTKP